MNRILFISVLVGIVCMTASEVLFTTFGDKAPEPSPQAVTCFEKTKSMQEHCIVPAVHHWNLTDYFNQTHPHQDFNKLCCFAWEATECIVHALPTSKCNSSEQNALKDFIGVFSQWLEKNDCVHYTRKSSSCKL